MYVSLYALSRGMVHALPFGSSHKLGFEDGLARVGRKKSKPKAFTATS